VALTSIQRALPVVAGILKNGVGQILLAQRAGVSEAGKWEFAGGKIQPGEAARAALARELNEELGIHIGAAQLLTCVRWRGAPRALNLHAYEILDWQGEPTAHEHRALQWVAPTQLIHYAMPAPDRPIRARLALPPHYLITPEPLSDASTFLDDLSLALANPLIGIVSLRAKSLSAAALANLAARFLARARAQRPDLILLMHGEIELARQLGFDGVHLSAAQVTSLRQRPLGESAWVFASCHSQVELRAAQALGADAATLSPIKTTLSHPGQRPLGDQALSRASKGSFLPIYALGGMLPTDLATVRAAGAHGIAAIRGWWPAD